MSLKRCVSLPMQFPKFLKLNISTFDDELILKLKVLNYNHVIHSFFHNDILSNRAEQPKNEELLMKRKLIQMEHESGIYLGEDFPSMLTESDIDELLQCSTSDERIQRFAYLWRKEQTKERRTKKSEEIKLAEWGSKPFSEIEKHTYININPSAIKTIDDNRLAYSMMFGQNIVYDLGFDPYLTKPQSKSAALNLISTYIFNRRQLNPYHVHFCNTNFQGNTFKHFELCSQDLYKPHFLCNVTEKSYLDIFPKEKLIYLTPYARDDFLEYDHDAIYIIGACVSMNGHKPISLNKAKEEGIKFCQLPIHRYLRLNEKSRPLSILRVTQIMSEMKHSGSWEKAFKHFPEEFLKQDTAKKKFTRKINHLTHYECLEYINRKHFKSKNSRNSRNFEEKQKLLDSSPLQSLKEI